VKSHESVEDNLRFLIIEVKKQLVRTAKYMSDPSPMLLASVVAGDDYIDNLKTIIQSKCFKLAAEASQEGDASVAFLKMLEVVAVNLERISDFCERVADQWSYVEDDVRQTHDFQTFFNEVVAGVSLIEQAVFDRDMKIGLQICAHELNLDRLYGKTYASVLNELREGAEPKGRVTLLFIAHYLERMGDSLLNIGEAILSVCVGERIKIGQLKNLEDSLEDIAMAGGLDRVALKAVGETKSGARVGQLSMQRDTESSNVIFKEGKTRKLIEERTSIDRWNEVAPGLAPKVFAFHEGHEDSALLFEYLPGHTFEELLLQDSNGALFHALDALTRTLSDLWLRTRRAEPSQPRFLQQLQKRLSDVYAVHPEFAEMDGKIGDVQLRSFSALMAAAENLDKDLSSPFSVFIHGDFNIDNIIYAAEADSIRFIDLHRSRHLDYVQDVSVFLVSNFRLQVFQVPVRRRINQVVERFLGFAETFAANNGDKLFPARLALGVVRSFATSTRFVLGREQAHTMFSRSRYLLQQVVSHSEQGRLDQFAFPREVLLD
jgi:phosphate uptake regulator/aminoglycoside phosphotransferase (APT) family kinase protein